MNVPKQDKRCGCGDVEGHAGWLNCVARGVEKIPALEVLKRSNQPTPTDCDAVPARAPSKTCQHSSTYSCGTYCTSYKQPLKPTPASVNDAQTVSIPVADIAFASEEYRQALLDKGQVMVAPLPARVEQPASEGGEWPRCACGGVAVTNASGDITRTCIRCGKIVSRPTPPATGEAAKLAAVPESTGRCTAVSPADGLRPSTRCSLEKGHVNAHYDDGYYFASEDEIAASLAAWKRSPNPAPVGDVEQAELPPLEPCPKELLHGYPDCDCDLEGGDDSCTKKPTHAEVNARYARLHQRERQLRAERAAHKATREKGEKLCGVLGNLLIHIHDLGLRKADGFYGKFNYRNDRAESVEAENQELRQRNERLTDLVRHQRHELFAIKLIDQKEYAALVADSERGQRVARLEGYDELRRKVEDAVEELRTVDAVPTVRSVIALLTAKEGQ